MNLRRWLSVILTMGLFLVLSPLGAQADPPFDRYYQPPHGNAYGWHGTRPHEFERHRNYYRHACRGPHPRYVREVYVAQPPVALVAPVAPMIVPQPQPYYAPSVPQGLHGSISFGY